MKHIFYIHSPITYLIAVSVCRYLDLPAKDALFICDGFNRNTEIATVKDISEYNKGKNILSRSYKNIKYFNKAKFVDKIISDFILGYEFIAYVPVMRFVEKVIVTHRKCKGFNFIEEGLAHYYKGETLYSLSIANVRYDWRTSIFRKRQWNEIFRQVILLIRGYNMRLLALPFSYSCYNQFENVRFFGITRDTFPMIDEQKRQIIPLTNDLKPFYNDLELDNGIVWIGDNGVDYYGFSKELYLEGIKKGVIKYLKEEGRNKLFVKYHRGESQTMRSIQIEIFKAYGIDVVVISDNVILEEILLHSKNVTLYGVYSSLLYYASVMGHRALSIYELLKRDYAKNLEGKNMDFFWSKVQAIPAE
jgi:hypothetical protein